jgi:antitoxin MazE
VYTLLRLRYEGDLYMKIHTTVQKWGNSLAIRITGPLKSIPHFTANMPVEIEVKEKGLTIYPITKKKENYLFLKSVNY